MSLEIPTTKKCDHLTVPCVCLANKDVTEVCMACVMTCPCNIILTLESQSVEVAYEQSMSPSLYVDLWCYLPMCLFKQWTYLAAESGYDMTQREAGSQHV